MVIEKYKRIVIKVGSALLVEAAAGAGNADKAPSSKNPKQDMVRKKWLVTLVKDIADLKNKGQEVLVVSSGATALGRALLNIEKTTGEELETKQAASAIGQIALMATWREMFASHDILVAQILLTPQDTEERHRHVNGRATIDNLLSRGVVPIINENDSVATDELKYGDNDRLSARVASMVSADLLVLLSDVDGLYDTNPKTNKLAKHIARVEEINDSILQLADTTHDQRGTGGMVTKLQAGKIANGAGIDMLIASGIDDHPLKRLSEGQGRATIFVSQVSALVARKKWIKGLLNHEAEMVIDDGALLAIKAGKSLLPAGVRSLSHKKDFEKGAAILIKNMNGQRLGVGLINHDSDDAVKMVGKKSAEIKKIFPSAMKIELIDRDNLVLD